MLLLSEITKLVAFTNKTLGYATKAAAFCLKKINDNLEVGLLLISTGVFNQFLNLNEH